MGLSTNSKKIMTSSAEVWLDNEGIVWVVYQLENLDVAHIKENFKAIEKASHGKARPVINIVQRVMGTSRAAREFGASKEVVRLVSALALVTSSSVSTMLGNFFMYVSQPPYPTRLFLREYEALQWLRGYIHPGD